jgi:hypothetical protein
VLLYVAGRDASLYSSDVKVIRVYGISRVRRFVRIMRVIRVMMLMRVIR